MLVYRIDVELTEPACNVERKEREERAGVMQSKTETLFGACEYAYHITKIAAGCTSGVVILELQSIEVAIYVPF